MKIKNEKNLKVTIISSISNWYVWIKIVNLYEIFLYQTAEKYEFWAQKKRGFTVYNIYKNIYLFHEKYFFNESLMFRTSRVKKSTPTLAFCASSHAR